MPHKLCKISAQSIQHFDGHFRKVIDGGGGNPRAPASVELMIISIFSLLMLVRGIDDSISQGKLSQNYLHVWRRSKTLPRLVPWAVPLPYAPPGYYPAGPAPLGRQSVPPPPRLNSEPVALARRVRQQSKVFNEHFLRLFKKIFKMSQVGSIPARHQNRHVSPYRLQRRD